MKHYGSIPEIRRARAAFTENVGFVPTMGALHAGHLALVKAAKQRCDHVIASIFVNPKQFAPSEDLSRYPRPLSDDLALLKAQGVDLVFTPQENDLYPEGFATTVTVAEGSDVLCGAHRAGHFAGVTTVVSLLFSIIRPDAAFFGEKDFQQLTLIRRLNHDLCLIEEVVGIPTVREADGLALSSRNAYLTAEERSIAPILHHTLQEIKRWLHAGKSMEESLRYGRKTLLEAGFASLDYLEIRDAGTLSHTEDLANARLFAAVRLGTTRLIDNISLATQTA